MICTKPSMLLASGVSVGIEPMKSRSIMNKTTISLNISILFLFISWKGWNTPSKVIIMIPLAAMVTV